MTGVRYNRVNLSTKITNLTLKTVRYNRVRQNRVALYLQNVLVFLGTTKFQAAFTITTLLNQLQMSLKIK